MKKPTREEIFALSAKKLRQEFEELQNVPHSGVRGGEAEKIIRTFLNEHLPGRFAARAGFIIDPVDQVTGHNDVIIYDQLNCPLYRVSDEGAIIPNDNVAALIEVKSSLDKASLESAAQKISEAKKLGKHKPDTSVDIFGRPINYETLGIVFAYSSPLSFNTLADHYLNSIRSSGIGLHIDFVILLDQGIMSLSADPEKNGQWGVMIWYQSSAIEGLHLCVGAMELGERTLDSFLRILLAHLQLFRHMIDHPGFNWSTEITGQKVRVSYLTTLTNEQDPKRKEQILAKYAAEARKLIMGS